MATAVQIQTKSLKDPKVREILQDLRRTDNFTNIYYFIRIYLYFAVVIGGTIWFYHQNAPLELGWWWNIPVTLLAIVLVGAGQHQLTGLAHEASHHILFKNRLINDLASDWLCMFPMYSATQHYRLQHLAHHQFVNDPVRDPDISQLQTSGHWLDFPLGKGVFVKTLLKQLWIPNLIRFIRIRAKYNAIPTDKNPYLKKGWKPGKTVVRVGIVYMAVLVAVLTTFVRLEEPLLLGLVPLGLYLAAMIFYSLIPADMFHQSRVHPVISMRAMSLMRITYITGLFCGLAWLSLLVDPYAVLYYFLLWLVPIFTSFSFFMILRQIVQHGNGGRGWLTNTRVFFVNRMINFAVFPIGQDLHLPHHLFASVPHYRLRRLHEALLEFPEYREQAVVVEGYFLPPHRPQTHPTVVDVLGPEYAHPEAEVYIDNEVLVGEEVEDREEILRQGQAEIERARNRSPVSN
jgi:fatty acid desaturase